MSTTVYNARTLTAAAEYDTTAIKATGDFATFTASATLVNGTTPPTPGRQIVVKYLITSTDLGNTPAISSLSSTGRIVFTTDGTASATYTRTASLPNDDQDGSSDSEGSLVGISGTHMYVWLSHDDLGSPVTITLTVTSGVDGLQGKSSGYLLLNSLNEYPIVLNGAVVEGEIPVPVYPEDITHHFKFNNGSLASSINSNDVAIAHDGNPTYGSGIVGGQVVFDGFSSLNLGNLGRGNGDAISVALWVRIPDPLNEDGQGIFSTGDPNDGSTALLEFLWHNGTTKAVWVHVLGDQIIVDSTDVNLGDGNWHHIAFTYESAGNSLILYIDGVDKGSTTVTSTAGGAAFLGCRTVGNEAQEGTGFFKGIISDVVIAGRALTSGEIADLCDEGTNVADIVTGTLLTSGGSLLNAPKVSGNTVSGNTVEVTTRLVIPVLSAAPSTPVVGEIYFDASNSVFYGYNGDNWMALSAEP